MKALFTSFLLLIVTAQLIACNTIQGLGKDVQRGGEAIEKTAK
ncbi:entericidin, EcnA/B family [Nitrosomonas sp. HPC101]|nr:entericidin A/B family lipoprotein [Nitrosomonas sp. HPC101]MXS86465.1 entericidin, EcnA/B family [Nitrosomonas sp. HPC101]